MNQAELNRAIACATGESVSTIKRLGFLLADPIDELDPESEEYGPHVIDWDELEFHPPEGLSRGHRHEAAVA